jgi:hypothetical protein
MTPSKFHKVDYGEMGPAMKRLPNDRWRAFVTNYVTDPTPGLGQATRAHKAAFPKANGATARNHSHHMMHDARVIAAIAEEGKRFLRAFYPVAQARLFQIIIDPNPASLPSVVRAIGMILDRCDPVETKQVIDVTHTHVDASVVELQQYRACKAMGADQARLEAIFGFNGASRLAARDAAERGDSPKLIEAQVVDGDDADVAAAG